jgi:L-proline cis-4-hydroxylase
LSAQCLGQITLSDERLRSEVGVVLALSMHPCVDGVGSWTYRALWQDDQSNGESPDPGVRRSLPYIDEVIERVFRIELLRRVWVFAAKQGGYIRPHRDWQGTEAVFTRLHIPIQTNNQCFNSEDDLLYHMDVGEIWFIDGNRPHSGGCFSESCRLHLALDFVPQTNLIDLFRDREQYRPSSLPRTINRTPFTAAQLSSIYSLAAVASDLNLTMLLDLLGAVHFEKQVDCAAVYDWLIEIARRTGNPELIRRAENIRVAYLGPTLPASAAYE